MDASINLYRASLPIAFQASGMRIYAPVAYPAVRQAQIVPIIHIEALPMAAWFPVVWRQTEHGVDLVVVRSLLADGRGQPARSPKDPRSLPLIFRAYPFKMERKGQGGEAITITLDDAFADEPTDAGAPILSPAGELGRGAEQRCRALAVLAHMLPQTQAITQYLLDADLLEPWPLALALDGVALEVPDLLVVRPGVFRTGGLAGFASAFGPTGARFLVAHRLSLFRAGVLAGSARTALRKAQPAGVEA